MSALAERGPAPSARVGEGRLPPLARWRARLDDRANPVLVKEVRQALRGRVFRVSLALTIATVTVVSIGMLIGHPGAPPPDLGRTFFGTVHVLLSIAVLGLVPFSAFVSMGGEWEEHTFDLLVISNLRPRAIVLGKLATAAVEAALYFAAFLPFLVLAFLLRGVGIGAIVLVLLLTFAASLSAAAVALALSCLVTARAARVVTMAALAGGLLFLVVAAGELARQGLRGGSSAPDAAELLGLAAGIAAPGLVALTFACQRLAHAEENRSTAMRVLVGALQLAALACFAPGFLDRPDPDDLAAAGIGLVVASGAFAVFFATEPETLRRRVRREVPARRAAALASAAWLPGGGRGLLHFVLHAAFVIAALAVLAALAAASGPHRHGSLGAAVLGVAVFAAYVIVYVGLPSLVFSARTGRASARRLAWISILLLVPASILLPALVGFLVDEPDWAQMRHPFNPVHVVSALARGSHVTGLWAAGVLAVAALVLALNLPRIARGVHEVLAASRARAGLEADERRAAP